MGEFDVNDDPQLDDDIVEAVDRAASGDADGDHDRDHDPDEPPAIKELDGLTSNLFADGSPVVQRIDADSDSMDPADLWGKWKTGTLKIIRSVDPKTAAGVGKALDAGLGKDLTALTGLLNSNVQDGPAILKQSKEVAETLHGYDKTLDLMANKGHHNIKVSGAMQTMRQVLHAIAQQLSAQLASLQESGVIPDGG